MKVYVALRWICDFNYDLDEFEFVRYEIDKIFTSEKLADEYALYFESSASTLDYVSIEEMEVLSSLEKMVSELRN